MRVKIQVLATTAALSLPVLSIATPVEWTSLMTATGQSFRSVIDRRSGLEWLSPTATIRKTFGQIEAGDGGWTTLGFRYATQNEWIELMALMGVTISVDPATGSQSFSASDDTAAFRALISHWGPTSVSNLPSPGSPFGQQNVFGIFGDAQPGDGYWPISRTMGWFGATDGVAFVTLGARWRYEDADALVGSFLVRSAPLPVPLPDSFWLACAALGTLAGLHRKTRLTASEP